MKAPRSLFIAQFDRRFGPMVPAMRAAVPRGGWLQTLRSGLGFTLAQLADRLNVSRQHIGQLEKREAEGTVTLKSLREVAEALDMELFYAFIPKDGSLRQLIDRRAREVARAIVMRTHQSMKLEDQAVSDERLRAAIEEQAAELRREVPKLLWD